MKNTAFLFPGQGSQYIGMGKDFFEKGFSKDLFERANEALGFDITSLCLNGPQEQLDLTENTQPAIFLISAAILGVVQKRGIDANWAAGHSLGEYSALFFSGAINFEDAIRLVKTRGRYMQEAAPVGSGAMAAIVGINSAKVEDVCCKARETGDVWAANFNSPEQTVIAGSKSGVDEAMKLAKESGAKLAVLLPVSAPFHTPLIKEAEKRLRERMEQVTFMDLSKPVVTNVDALAIYKAQEAKQALIRQVCAPVKWVDSIQFLVSQGVDTFIEIGPGKVLTGLLRRISKNVKGINIYDVDTLEKAVEAIGNG